MAGTESIVFRFVSSQKTRDASGLFDRFQLFAASGQDLVRVCLMTNVPYEPVVRRVKDIMHRHRQLHSSKTCSCMTADLRTRINNILTHFVGNFLQVFDL